MKILISSYFFAPSVGGIETVSALLAPEFVKAGHEVVLVTSTGEEDNVARPFAVHRNPKPFKMLELVRWCDVYFQNNISLLFAWPLLFVRRPWIIAHHTWIGRMSEGFMWRGQLKRMLLRHGVNVTISRAIADDLPIRSTVVGNPYNDTVFKRRPEIPRERELVYLGRLVSDKGVDLLLRALVELRARGLAPRLTVIGSGPEEVPLRVLADQLGISDQIEFTGVREGHQISKLLNAHQILVVPSRWPEPFGIVVLEGLACGCVVVAAAAGGLPDAVGPCGIKVGMEDKAALVEALQSLLTQPELRARLLREADAHLVQFQPATIAAKYLQLIERTLQTS